jgi:hypothetical protein
MTKEKGVAFFISDFPDKVKDNFQKGGKLGSTITKGAATGLIIVELATACTGPIHANPTSEFSPTPSAITEVVTNTPWITGQQVGPVGIEQSTSTPIVSTTQENNPTLKVTPSPIATSTSAATATVAVPENPGTFEGVGVIASVEQNPADGKWYGIDSMGRAEIVLENGVWTLYERPVDISMQVDESENLIPEAFLKEVNQSEITRLNDGGVELPWGLIRQVKPEDGYDYTNNYISGYALGAYPEKDSYQSWIVFVFEVPLKYSRQILAFEVANATFAYNVSFIPASGDIQKLDQNPLVWNLLSKILLNPVIRGKRMVVVFPTNICSDPDAATDCESVLSGLDLQDKQLLTSMANGQATSITSNINPQEMWLDESYNPFK